MNALRQAASPGRKRSANMTTWKFAMFPLLLGVWLAPPPALATEPDEPAAAATTEEPEPASEAEEESGPIRREGQRNTGLLVGGIVCAGVGGLMLLTGGVMLALASEDSTQVCENGNCHPATQQDRDTMQSVGVGAVVAGAVLAVAGIPMIVVGAKRRAAEARPMQPMVGIGVGPRGASLHVRF